jgi:hypothetical protein
VGVRQITKRVEKGQEDLASDAFKSPPGQRIQHAKVLYIGILGSEP